MAIRRDHTPDRNYTATAGGIGSHTLEHEQPPPKPDPEDKTGEGAVCGACARASVSMVEQRLVKQAILFLERLEVR